MGRVRRRGRVLGSSPGYRRKHLLVGFRMDRLGVGRGFVRREIVGVGEHRMGMESVRGKDRVRRRVAEDFEVGRSFVHSLVPEDRQCCLGCIEVVGGMAEEVRHHMVVEVDTGLSSHHHRSLGWTFLFVCLL